MSNAYVHGYDPAENERLRDQAGTLVDLLHSDTEYPSGSLVLEAGCGVGAQTVTLATRSPHARFISVDVSAESLAEAGRRAEQAGLANVELRQAEAAPSPSSKATTALPTSIPQARTPPPRSAARWSSNGEQAATL